MNSTYDRAFSISTHSQFGTQKGPVLDFTVDFLAHHPTAVDTLAEWHHAQWNYLDRGVTLEQRASALRRHRTDGIPLTVVAFAGETVLGSASLIQHDMDTRMELSPWLASVYVAPEYRRQRVGGALVRRIECEATTLGHKTLYLFTPDMQRFYETLGWIALESTVYRGYPQIVMAQHL